MCLAVWVSLRSLCMHSARQALVEVSSSCCCSRQQIKCVFHIVCMSLGASACRGEAALHTRHAGLAPHAADFCTHKRMQVWQTAVSAPHILSALPLPPQHRHRHRHRHRPSCQQAPDKLPRTLPCRSDSANEKAAGEVDASHPFDAPGEEDALPGWGPPSPKRRKGEPGSQQQEAKAALAAMTAQAEENQDALAQEQAKNEQLVAALQEVG